MLNVAHKTTILFTKTILDSALKSKIFTPIHRVAMG
jgi:hypothetical protein